MINTDLHPTLISKLDPVIRRSVFGKNTGITHVSHSVPESLSKKKQSILDRRLITT